MELSSGEVSFSFPSSSLLSRVAVSESLDFSSEVREGFCDLVSAGDGASLEVRRAQVILLAEPVSTRDTPGLALLLK